MLIGTRQEGVRSICAVIRPSSTPEALLVLPRETSAGIEESRDWLRFLQRSLLIASCLTFRLVPGSFSRWAPRTAPNERREHLVTNW